MEAGENVDFRRQTGWGRGRTGDFGENWCIELEKFATKEWAKRILSAFDGVLSEPQAQLSMSEAKPWRRVRFGEVAAVLVDKSKAAQLRPLLEKAGVKQIVGVDMSDPMALASAQSQYAPIFSRVGNANAAALDSLPADTSQETRDGIGHVMTRAHAQRPYLIAQEREEAQAREELLSARETPGACRRPRRPPVPSSRRLTD